MRGLDVGAGTEDEGDNLSFHPITMPGIQTGSDRFPTQVIGSRVGMAKGMNH